MLVCPELPLDRSLLDGSGRADFAAQGAVELTETDREVHDRRPEPFEPALRQGRGLEHVGRTDVDALVALDAALEELALLHRAGRTDHLLVESAVIDGGGEAEERIGESARHPCEHPATPRQVRSLLHGVETLGDDLASEERGRAVLHRADDPVLPRNRSEPEGESVLGAVVDTVEADETLTLPKRGLRIRGAATALEAEITVRALRHVPVDPPETESGEDSKERTERAENAAEEAGDDQVHPDQPDDDETHEPGAVENPLVRCAGGGREEARIERVDVPLREPGHHRGVGLVGRGGDGHGERTHEQTDRVEQTDLERAERGHDEEDPQDDVLELIDRAVTVLVDVVLVRADVEDPAHELMKRSVRAHPVAEHPSQDESRDQHPERLVETAIDRAGRERGGEAHERIGLEEERYGIAAHPAEPRHPDEEDEESEENGLAHDPDGRDPESPPVPGSVRLLRASWRSWWPLLSRFGHLDDRDVAHPTCSSLTFCSLQFGFPRPRAVACAK